MQPIAQILNKRIGRARYRAGFLLSKLTAKSPPRRIVFMHIPKCAGSSVTMLFKSQLGSGRSKHVFLFDETGDPAAYHDQIERARDARFVGGHFGFDTLEKIRGDAWVFTILRDPFERLRSNYGHLRTRVKTKSSRMRHTNMDLEDFLLSDEPHILHHTDNVMARMLAMSTRRDAVHGLDAAALSRLAISNLAAFDHVGLSDALDLSLFAAAKAAGIRSTSHRENATAEKAEINPPPEAVKPFDPAIRALAIPRVTADFAVYDHVRAGNADFNQQFS